MANRAYLFSADRPDDWGFPNDRYYDSRWNIPLSWFFFYEPPDIKHVRVSFLESAWDELKFVAGKEGAVRRFETRRPVMEATIGTRIPAGLIDALFEDVRGWPGQYLLLDPGEVLDDDAEKDFDPLSRILHAIEIGDPEAVIAAVYRYVGPFYEDPDRCCGQVIGYTYW